MTQKTTPLSIAIVLECVSAAFEVSVRDIRSHKRPDHITHARFAVCLLAYELTEFGTPAIARQLGGRDHTTIIAGKRRAEELCASSSDYAARVEAARQAAHMVGRSHIGWMFADVDAAAAAARICADPTREVTRASSAVVLAMAARLLDLEDVAADAFSLLSKLDELVRLRADVPAEQLERRQLAGSIRALTDTLTGALASLGYRHQNQQENATDDDTAIEKRSA